MKVLAIGTHFDDVELGCGGTLLKHISIGDEVDILVVTHSGYIKETEGFERAKSIAKEEGEKSAHTMGANLYCMDKDPLNLVPTEAFVFEIERYINKIEPDRIYTHQPTDTHSDHAAVGTASLRACRKCKEVFLYRSNWYIMDNSPKDNYYVDISDFVHKKMELLHIYKIEMEKVNYAWIDFVKKQNEAAGARIYADAAETFHIEKQIWI